MSVIWESTSDFPPLSLLPEWAQDRIRQVRIDLEEDPSDESEYYRVCLMCGQAIDERSLYQVMHHNEAGHDRLTEAELTGLA